MHLLQQHLNLVVNFGLQGEELEQPRAQEEKAAAEIMALLELQTPEAVEAAHIQTQGEQEQMVLLW